MAFVPKKQAYGARINAVTLGRGERAAVIGGANTMPFCGFDAPAPNRPLVAVEITDLGLPDNAPEGLRAWYAGCEGIEALAGRACEMPGASALCLSFEGADPLGANATVRACADLAKRVAGAVGLPLICMGCGNAEKDAALLAALSEALEGENALMLSAREENYRAVGAAAGIAYGQKVGAESSVDINLAKQLNVLLTQIGVAPDCVCMNLGSACAGYGFEYLASTMERVRLAALAQNDALLQMPVVTPVAAEAWAVKEAVAPEAENPGWGSAEERGIHMEICTAAACLVSGSDLVILRHPAAVAAVAEFIDSLS